VSEPELTPEQLIEAIKEMKVSDMVVSTVMTLAQLAYAKLDEGTRDLDDARLAIESLRVLVAQLEGHVTADVLRDLNTMVANVQLAYASAAAPPSPPVD
jgi:Domain of unknown function (DUF1844)